MVLKKLGVTVFAGVMLTGFGYGMDRAPKVKVEIIEPTKVRAYEEDDFRRIRREMYANGTKVREFLYFSRWHEYLEQVEEEKLRQEAYEYSLREYETEVEKVNKVNRKIRKHNESTTYTNVPQGDSVDISRANYTVQNADDSKND
ncbi:hypothetical protein EII29_04790 [Leptotrichia sp. OH3620_COT-345]|uniref:hypothetical protein n=1 Tax=Leptotrichia sp. OH3620_COT-345 TaxID=2491048 RepID=UPI000F6499EE|nr:hypothetical protein [Leptotrichia sp. OH3620_COT-345]RRD39842.1 hypothetical protein EII29_04790 [Leptotrichia sp. OH3620_COT-345]